MITAATSQDIPGLIELVNSAYRGPGSRRGWTTEADLLDGELRTDDESMKTLMKKPDATILKFLSGEQLTGCVYLEKQKEDFIGIATHELKTPVTSIKAYAQILLNRFRKEGNECSPASRV